MNKETWKSVEDYISSYLIPQDPALTEALKDSTAAGLPAIEVPPTHGKLLHLLARILNAKRVLEIGTLGGYSTIWLARALPAGGVVTTLERDPKHAEIAKANIARARLSDKVDLRLGAALDTLPQLKGPFDLAFIDADKENNAVYVDWAIRLSRPGAVIVIDNVVREGAILDETSSNPQVQGVQRLYKALAHDSRLDATALQTVAGKGYDGVIMGVVKG